MQQTLILHNKKKEELEFKLCQKEEEIRLLSEEKNSVQTESKIFHNFKEEVKKKEQLKFNNEQLVEQLEQYKQHNRELQQQVEVLCAASEHDKRERARCMLEERTRYDKLQLRLDTERESMISEWRREFGHAMLEQQNALSKELIETKKIRKQLEQQQSTQEAMVAERVRAELARLVELEESLKHQERLQEDIQEALAERQRTIETNEASLEQAEARVRTDRADIEAHFSVIEKEKSELNDRMWVIDLESKRMQEKVAALEIKNIKLVAENRGLLEANVHLQEQLQRHKSRASMIPLLPEKVADAEQKQARGVQKENKPALQPTVTTGATSKTQRDHSSRKSMIPIRRGSNIALK